MERKRRKRRKEEDQRRDKRPHPQPLSKRRGGVKCEIPLWRERLTPKRFSKDREERLTLIFSKVGRLD